MSPDAQPLTAQIDGLAIVVQVLLARSQGGLGAEHLGERGLTRQYDLALLVGILASRHVGGRVGDVEPPAPFLSTLEEAGDIARRRSKDCSELAASVTSEPVRLKFGFTRSPAVISDCLVAVT